MTALPLTADPPQFPDPHQGQAADSPARTFRLRRVLGKLITHAKRMAEDLTRRPSRGSAFWITVRFGTKDIALILARITRGLRLAAALQATLPKPPQGDQREDRRERPASSAPDAHKPRTRPTPLPRNNADSVLADLPTSKEIADLLRHRPIGDVLTEICIDLGILAVEDIWQELQSVLAENGGAPDTIAADAERRIAFSTGNFFPPDIWRSPPPQSAPRFAATAPAGTGPPA